jgi:hypothetical protein
MENKEKEPRKLKRKKAGIYGLAKRRGVDQEDWNQERLLQAYLVIGAWPQPGEKGDHSLPEPEQTTGEEEPEIWPVLDRIDDQTLAACIRYDHDRPSTDTLDSLVAESVEIMGADEMPDIVGYIMAVVPKQLQEYVADAYYHHDPLPQNIAAMVATYLWQIDELLPRQWRSKAQQARCIVTVR